MLSSKIQRFIHFALKWILKTKYSLALHLGLVDWYNIPNYYQEDI